MSTRLSPTTGRPYGVARVTRVWHVSRATVYHHRRALAEPRPARRPGPVGPCPDADLVAAIRAVLSASPFHGEGYRKVWARLRVAGVRTSRHRVRRLMRERAVAALAHSAMALDVYAWLAQRLHRVPEGKPQFIPWPALYSQFGQGYRRLRDFRAFFVNVLRQVKAVYPAARIEEVIGTRGEAQGLLLHHSPPPVNERTGRRRHLTVTTVDKPRG